TTACKRPQTNRTHTIALLKQGFVARLARASHEPPRPTHLEGRPDRSNPSCRWLTYNKTSSTCSHPYFNMATNSAFTLLGPKLDSKTVVAMLFREPSTLGRTCNACNNFVKQTKWAGNTNLLNHLVSKHPSYEGIARKCLREKRVVTMDMFVDRHTQETYQWMNLVVHKNFTFAGVDDETVRAAVKFNSMSSKTLKARMVPNVEPPR
ncbi:hypothetical protein PHYSODRAFT_259766, partial [Phytophthora sojae]